MQDGNGCMDIFDIQKVGGAVMQQLRHLFEQKCVLYVTTKNIDYIRVVQEIDFLKGCAAKLEVICADRQKYVLRILAVWWRLLCCGKNYDVVFFGFAPQLAAPFFWKYRKKVLVIDFFISVYDTLVNDRKKFSDRNPIARICHLLDAYVIRKADCVITDTKADAAYFIQEFRGNKDKFVTVYLEADRTVYYPRRQQKRRGLEGKFVILYFGSMLPLQGADIVLQAIALLEDEKDIFFQIIGPIPQKYDRPVQDNVEYIDWLEQEELAAYIANADLCLAGHFNAAIGKADRTIPGKAYIYEAMGKRMILGDSKANHERYDAADGVYWTKMGDADALAGVIVQFCHIQ